ncbi:Amino acid transporter AVT6B [Bienertia sinuspersici]
MKNEALMSLMRLPLLGKTSISTKVIEVEIMALPSTMKILGLGKTSTYGGVMEHSFGKVGRILMQVSFYVNNISVLIRYMIIIGNVFSGTSASGTHPSYQYPRRFVELYSYIVSWWELSTVVPILVTAYICHYNERLKLNPMK